MEALTGVALALAAAGVVLTVVFLAARIAIARRQRAAHEALEQMRPLALQIVYDEERPDLADLGERDLEGLATLVERYGRQLRGESRERLASFFVASGAVDRQRAAMQNGGVWRRATAAFSLGDMGAAAAVPDLIAALQDRDRAVRIAAARSLGMIGSPDAAPALVECLTDGRLPWLVGGQALIDIGGPAAATLRELSAAAGSPSRARAIELLGYVGDAGDAPFVREALSSESADLRERSARALGRLGARDAVEALRQRLADPEPAVAAAAATSLGSIGDRAVLNELLELARVGPYKVARPPRVRPHPSTRGPSSGPRTLPAPASTSAKRPIWRRSDARRAPRRLGGRDPSLLPRSRRHVPRVHHRRLGEPAPLRALAVLPPGGRGVRIAADARRLDHPPGLRRAGRSGRERALAPRAALPVAGGRGRERRVDGRDPGAAPRSVRPRPRAAGAARHDPVGGREPGVRLAAEPRSRRRRQGERRQVGRAQRRAAGRSTPAVRCDRRRRGDGRRCAAGGRTPVLRRSGPDRRQRRCRARLERLHD